MSLNYSDIQGIYRAEKKSPTLQKIGDNFYSELGKLISEIEEEYRENLSRIGEEIFNLRTGKIVRLAARPGESSPPINMIPKEREIYNSIRELIRTYKQDFFEGSRKTGESEKGKRGKIKRVRVRILRSIPAIVGSDTKHYGPFSENEEVELPEETARVLLEQEIAEMIS